MFGNETIIVSPFILISEKAKCVRYPTSSRRQVGKVPSKLDKKLLAEKFNRSRNISLALTTTWKKPVKCLRFK